MDECRDHHPATGHARLEVPAPFRSRVARAPGADVRFGQLESQVGHSLILAKSTTFWYLAVSSARNRAMSTFRGAMVEPDSSSFLRNSADCNVSLSAVRSLARTGAGRLGGAISASQTPMSMFFRLGDSASAGMSGAAGDRCF